MVARKVLDQHLDALRPVLRGHLSAWRFEHVLEEALTGLHEESLTKQTIQHANERRATSVRAVPLRPASRKQMLMTPVGNREAVKCSTTAVDF